MGTCCTKREKLQQIRYGTFEKKHIKLAAHKAGDADVDVNHETHKLDFQEDDTYQLSQKRAINDEFAKKNKKSKANDDMEGVLLEAAKAGNAAKCSGSSVPHGHTVPGATNDNDRSAFASKKVEMDFNSSGQLQPIDSKVAKKKKLKR